MSKLVVVKLLRFKMAKLWKKKIGQNYGIIRNKLFMFVRKWEDMLKVFQHVTFN